MAKRAIEHVFTGAVTPYTSYDPSKTNLGVLIQQRTGATSLDKFVGPMPIGLARPMEASTAIAAVFPYVVTTSNPDVNWVFLIDNGTAAATRRIIKYQHTISTGVFNWDGFITVTFPTATVHTVRGFRMTRDFHITGTASVSGTTVTGSGTTWLTDGVAVGSRIGFGSTVPGSITTWYEVASIVSDTSITLTASAGTITNGAYVVEELRAVIATTNATPANGGLFVVKGLRDSVFSNGGTTIPAATTTDNIRACYWLADASTVTNTIACGSAIEDRDSFLQHYIYVIDGTTTTNRVYKYNIRAPLAGLSSGKSVSAFVLVTAAQTPTGTCSQLNNGRIGVLTHGPASGVESLYFVTTTRVYRAALSNITSGNPAWQSDAMIEVPPGGSVTYPLNSALSSVEIADSMDRLIVMSSGTAGARSYVTKYNTTGDPFDHIFLSDDKQYDQSTTDSGATPHPAISALPFSVWSEGGISYMARVTASVTLNQLYAVPTGVHWAYAGQAPYQRLITPSLDTTDASTLYRVYVNNALQLGSGTLGLQPEPYRMFYRTSGISDDSGAWNALDDTHDFTGVIPGAAIQFMFEFKILGENCIPARIYSMTLVYEDNTTDSHYQPSVGQSSTINKIFAWRFSTAFSSTVPNLRIRLYNAETGGLLLDDTTTAESSGVFEKSTNDGSAWGAYDTTDKGNETTYIRYTPTSLADNIKVRALLTQN
ncbi:MAG: hypothetical protein KBC11_01535 [Candidatus Pacebacteria bacterium]|nr:hypothetical protein [Candidatus Paceibacterota bacterium]